MASPYLVMDGCTHFTVGGDRVRGREGESGIKVQCSAVQCSATSCLWMAVCAGGRG